MGYHFKAILTVFTILQYLVVSQAYNLTAYSSFKYCQTNATCNAASECCGYIEYERNGAPMQTSSRCLPIDKFEDLWNQFVEGNKNIEYLSIGCRLDTEEGLLIDPEATSYAGPEFSGGITKITQRLILMSLSAIVWLII